MKTRGKTKNEGPGQDSGKDYGDFRENFADGFGILSGPDDKNDDMGYSKNEDGYESYYADMRSKTKYQRGNNAKRNNRRTNLRSNRGRNDKHLLESPEFKEVVQGFIEFIEEINKKKKKLKKQTATRRTGPAPEMKLYKESVNTETRKKTKYDSDNYHQGQDYEGAGQHLADQAKAEKNGLYRFKDDVNFGEKDFFELLKKEKEQNSLYQMPYHLPYQDQKNVVNGYQNVMDYSLDPRYNLLSMKQANSKIGSFLFEDPNLQYKFKGKTNMLIKSKEMIQRFQMPPNLNSYYLQPNDYYSSNGLGNMGGNLRMMMESLRQTQPALFTALAGNNYGQSFQDISKDLAYLVQNMAGAGNQRSAGLGLDVIQGDADIESIGVNEKKPFKRAATHVAIAYFIYLKSIDYNNVNKMDKTKMDPTYNARVLKEKKKYEMFSDPSILGGILPFNEYMGVPGMYSQLEEHSQLKVDEKDQIAEIQAKQENLRSKTEENQQKEEVIDLESKDEGNKPNQDIAIKEEKTKVEEKVEETEIHDQNKMLNNSENSSKIETFNSGITPNDIVEEITELTNPQAEPKRKKNANKKPKKSKDEAMKIEKFPDDTNSTKIKIKRDDLEEKVEEDAEEPANVHVIAADDFKIHIEKEPGDTLKIKMKPEGGEES